MYASAYADEAGAILRILTAHSRMALLLGLRWIILLHVNDEDYDLEPICHDVRFSCEESSLRSNALVNWDDIPWNDIPGK